MNSLIKVGIIHLNNKVGKKKNWSAWQQRQTWGDSGDSAPRHQRVGGRAACSKKAVGFGLFFFKVYLSLFGVYECLPACIYEYHVCARCLRKPEEGIRALVTNSCKPPCGCWEPSPGKKQEQSVLLTLLFHLSAPGLVFWNRALNSPGLASNSLCSQGWPWPSDPPASTAQVLRKPPSAIPVLTRFQASMVRWSCLLHSQWPKSSAHTAINQSAATSFRLAQDQSLPSPTLPV